MARTKELDRVAVDFARIDRAKAVRSRNIEIWDENLRYYLGNQWGNTDLGENEMQLTINKIFPFVRAQLPALMFSVPHFSVNSTRGSVDPAVADAREHLLNFKFSADHGGFAARMSILSAFLAYGCIKVGYTPTFVDNPKAGEYETDAEGNLIIEAQTPDGNFIPKLSRGDFMRDGNGNIIFDDDGMAVLHPSDFISEEDFFVRWVPYSMLLFDPEGTNDFRTHRWVAEEWIRPTEEVRRDPLLKNVSKIEPSETVRDSPLDDPITDQPLGIDVEGVDNMFATESVEKDKGRTRGWTIYDFDKKQIRVVVNTSNQGTGTPKLDRYIREDPMPPEMWSKSPKSGGPFHFLNFNETPGDWTALTDVEILLPLQDEINLTRSKISTHFRRADRKYVYEEGFIDDEREWSKLLGGGDMSFAKVSDVNLARPLEQAPMDNAIFAALPNTDKDFDELGGSGEQRGVARADSATQAAVLENRQQARESDRRDNLIRAHLISVASGLLKSMQANMTIPMAVRISDPKHPNAYTFNGVVQPGDIDGDFDVSIDVSSMQPRTNPIYRQQVLSLLQQIIVPMMSNPLGLQFLTPSFLDEMFEIFELGNTQIADELAAIAEKIGAQAQAAQQGMSPQAETGAQGQVAGSLSPSGADGTPVPTSRTQ